MRQLSNPPPPQSTFLSSCSLIDARFLCGVVLCTGRYYATSRDDKMSCVQCRDGMDCFATGMILADVPSQSGWWRSDNASLSFLQCLQPSNCVNGRCAPNRIGALCAVCEVGYHMATQGAECEKCASQSASIAGTIGFSILIAAALGVVFYVIWRTENIIIPKSTPWKEVRAFTVCYQSSVYASRLC